VVNRTRSIRIEHDCEYEYEYEYEKPNPTGVRGLMNKKRVTLRRLSEGPQFVPCLRVGLGCG